jgi:hypothetical protein
MLTSSGVHDLTNTFTVIPQNVKLARGPKKDEDRDDAFATWRFVQMV